MKNKRKTRWKRKLEEKGLISSFRTFKSRSNDELHMRGAKFQFESMQTYKARPLGQTSNSVESKKVKRNLSGWLYASFEKVPDSIFRKKINRK